LITRRSFTGRQGQTDRNPHYRESYGGEIRNADWRKQFLGKTHARTSPLNEGITKNISGATLSCRHVTEAWRDLATYEVCLKWKCGGRAAPRHVR